MSVSFEEFICSIKNLPISSDFESQLNDSESLNELKEDWSKYSLSEKNAFYSWICVEMLDDYAQEHGIIPSVYVDRTIKECADAINNLKGENHSLTLMMSSSYVLISSIRRIGEAVSVGDPENDLFKDEFLLSIAKEATKSDFFLYCALSKASGSYDLREALANKYSSNLELGMCEEPISSAIDIVFDKYFNGTHKRVEQLYSGRSSGGLDLTPNTIMVFVALFLVVLIIFASS
jgi:hypothetical protein